MGLVSFSHLLSWLLKKYHDLTVALLAGFMIGSLNKVWPWKEVLESRFIDGEEKVIQEANRLPATSQRLQASQIICYFAYCCS